MSECLPIISLHEYVFIVIFYFDANYGTKKKFALKFRKAFRTLESSFLVKRVFNVMAY